LWFILFLLQDYRRKNRPEAVFPFFAAFSVFVAEAEIHGAAGVAGEVEAVAFAAGEG
jgi:hypothetical protein